MGRRYANILETVGNTPVVKINRLAPEGVNLYVKIEAFNPLGSVKDRLALGVIEDAERTGQLKPGQTVVEATSGNTGIGLAMVCAAKGYPLVVTMAETFSVERRKLMRFLGAKVIITPAAARAVGMVEKTKELAAKHGWFFTGGSDTTHRIVTRRCRKLHSVKSPVAPSLKTYGFDRFFACSKGHDFCTADDASRYERLRVHCRAPHRQFRISGKSSPYSSM